MTFRSTRIPVVDTPRDFVFLNLRFTEISLLYFIAGILQNCFSDSDHDIDIQCDMLHILSTLCENDLHRKELFGSQVKYRCCGS